MEDISDMSLEALVTPKVQSHMLTIPIGIGESCLPFTDPQ